MKNKVVIQISSLSLLFLAIALTFTTCRQDTDGSQYYKPGRDVYYQGINPAEGSGGTLVTLTGVGLGDIRTVVFDKQNVPAPFQTTLNTDTHILFRVPDTAIGGPQNIIFTNSEGKSVTVPFKVIALPIVSTAWPTDFQANSIVNITGNNLDDVSAVVIDGTTNAATIVSKSKKAMVIKMPASTVNTGKLKITNVSGTVVVNNITFVNVDKALQVFTDDYMNGFGNWSWGGTYEPAAENIVTGTKSLKAAYDPGGTWGGLQMGNNGSIDVSQYRYFAFWVKGADVEKKFQFWLNWGNVQVITVAPNVWTYYKYDMVTTYAGVTSVNNVTFQIYDAGKTVYFDNIIFFNP